MHRPDRLATRIVKMLRDLLAARLHSAHVSLRRIRDATGMTLLRRLRLGGPTSAESFDQKDRCCELLILGLGRSQFVI